MMNISPVRISTQPAPRFSAGRAQGTVSDRFIDVSGIGTVSKTPDVMRMSVSLTEQGAGKKSRPEVVAKLNARAQALKSAIEELKLPVKLSSHMSVTRWVEYGQRGKEELKGFNGQYSLTLTAQKKPLAELKDIAAKLTDIAAAQDLDFGDANFDYSDRKGASLEAIQGAALAIGETVAAIAKAFGIKISEKPTQLSVGAEQSYGRSHNRQMAAMSLESVGGGGMSADVIETDDVQVPSPQINARYEIEGAAAPAAKAKKA